MSTAAEYWYNTESGQVEEGKRSSWTNLLGPFATRAEAEQALSTAKARNEEWDREDEEWRNK